MKLRCVPTRNFPSKRTEYQRKIACNENDEEHRLVLSAFYVISHECWLSGTQYFFWVYIGEPIECFTVTISHQIYFPFASSPHIIINSAFTECQIVISSCRQGNRIRSSKVGLSRLCVISLYQSCPSLLSLYHSLYYTVEKQTLMRVTNEDKNFN